VIVAAAIVACVTNARLTVFMIDSSRVSCSSAPSDPFRTVLVLFLLTARRWRAAIYAAAWSVVLVVFTIAASGRTPMNDFVFYELPKIASGEAFPQTEMPGTPLMNLSVYGETVRWRGLIRAWFDVNWFGADVGRPIASIYGLIVVLLTAVGGWAAWKHGWLTTGAENTHATEAKARGDARMATSPEARMRLAQLALSLTAFRSPFVGFVHGYIGTLWLLTLLAAEAPTTRSRAGWLAGFGLVTAAMALTPSPTPPPSLIPPPLSWIVFTSVVFSSVLLLNLGVVTREIAHAWSRRAGGTLSEPIPAN
jgi:hypothetical protein